jgi:hypothetical protein
MPIARVTRGECPLEAFRCESLLHHLIRRHIVGIIIVDEFVLQNGPVGEERGSDKCRDADRQVASCVASRIHSSALMFGE